VSGAFANETLREVVHSSIGGNELRVRLTDALSSAPLTVDDVTVALRANGAAVTSARPVTFDGSRATTLPPGAEMFSDPIALDVGAGQDIAVSVFISAPVQDVTQHSFANTTSYLASGDHTADTDGTAFTKTTTSWYMLDGLDVRTSYQHGARTVIFLDGINDIGHDLNAAGGTLTAAELIDGITAMVAEAREKGLRVIGGTLLPIGGSKYDTSAAEATLATVNQWIRTSGEFDAVIDFNHVVSDPSDPARTLPALNSGDGLHPDDAGYQAMADAIDLRLLYR
jgi:lysophospholipase L1-like esterase